MSEAFNSNMALVFLENCKEYWASRNEYFEREYFRAVAEKGRKYEYWSFNAQSYLESISHLQNLFDGDSYGLNIIRRERARAVEARRKCRSVHEKARWWRKTDEKYVDTFPCTPFRSEQDKAVAFKRLLKSIEVIENSEFYDWLSKQPAYLVAREKLISRKMIVSVPYWEMGGIPTELNLGLGEVRLIEGLAKSLLVFHYPDKIGQSISRSWLFNDELNTAVPKNVAKAAREVFDFLQERNVTSKLLNTSMQLISEGEIPERWMRGGNPEIDFYAYKNLQMSEKARNRLFVFDLANQLNGKYFSDRANNQRFPPEALADLCLLVGYSADVRQIQNLMSKLEERRSAFGVKSQSSILDPMFRNIEHEEIVKYFLD